MKPLPFPLPLRIGTDIVHVPRISRLLNHRGGSYLTRFTRRILDTHEQADFATRFKEILQLHNGTTSPPITMEMTRWLAGRFAAKEAARKAAPSGAAEIGWKDVVVRAQGGGWK
jgi:Phosphopantetheinyl transferase (holo-ACP synthase)